MSDDRKAVSPQSEALVSQIGAKAARKLKARRKGSGGNGGAGDGGAGVWFGLGMMGLIGWSVAVPTLLGAALGIWLDRQHSGSHPWTLALLVGGLTIGCLNAWRWVANEDRAMHEDADGGADG